MNDEQIKAALEQDARQITERKPDKMTRQAILDVRLRLQEFIGKHGFSQKQIGQLV